MKALQSLFASSLALIAILMLGLFVSSCSSEQKQPESEPGKNIVHETSLTEHPETLDMNEVAPETLSTALSDTVAKVEKTSGISVLRSVTCTGIESHEPVGEGSSFSLDVGKVWLYTKIEMPKGETSTIKHVWKLEGKAISTVELDVRGPSFRTRSYKTITDKMKGDWTVDVLAGNGELLESVAFTIE